MAGRNGKEAFHHLERLFRVGSLTGLADGALLERFASRRDEAAFAALVTRHGPTVLGVCRRILDDPRDVEDAFQATFLVLVRRVGSIREPASLAQWLYGVAYRVAIRARANAALHRSKERSGAVEAAEEAGGPDDSDDLRRVLDEEVNRLPESHRATIVLCDLQGHTHEAAARQLGWPLGTVKSRLSRARGRLRERLIRRGLAPLAGLPVVLLGPRANSATVPDSLVDSTIEVAVSIAAGGASTGAVSSTITSLSEGVLRAMIQGKVKTVVAALLAFGVVAAGAGVLARQEPEGRVDTKPPPREAPDKPAAATARSPIRYVVDPPDILAVRVLAALPGRPISGTRRVQPDGKIALDHYGDVYVAGLTIPEVKERIVLHLRKFLPDDKLGLIEAGAPVPPRESDQVYVDVDSYNSKHYYVYGDIGLPGRYPITGNETVLDAIGFAGGILPTAAPQNIRLVRPAPPGACCDQLLPVNYAAIIDGGDTTTNYQIMPGDRLVVYRDKQAEDPVGSGKDDPARPSDRSNFRALEDRMKAVERKLDRVIEALEDPRVGPGRNRD